LKTKNKAKSPVRKEIDLSLLNSDQEVAFNKLLSYILDREDHKVYVLKGWAGTGKTFCISMLINYIINEVFPNRDWYKIAVTGPTNKSVRVIKKASGLYHPRVSFQTIHSLLGLKEKITPEGKIEFVNESDFKPGIASTRLLIIDEVSMLNDELFEKILKYREKTKIICMGDPAQIPPVGRPDCIPFLSDLHEEYGIKTLQLKTIMRQKLNNPIISTSVLLRKSISLPNSVVKNESQINSDGEGIEFINLNDESSRKSFSTVLASYFKTETFEKNSDYCKIIAWRNKTVQTMNAVVRKVIYGELAAENKILEGEKLIVNSPIIENGLVSYNTNDELTVESFLIQEEKTWVDNEVFTLTYYQASVVYLNENGEAIKDIIDIIHEKSEADFKKAANILRLIAISKRGKERTWVAYYDFLRRFADVSYSYAITAHKSQGSTYSYAFLSEDDINLNPDVVERNRIKYTAYTRASKKLYVLKRF
jgi:exodeoxyribonuclease-5